MQCGQFVDLAVSSIRPFSLLRQALKFPHPRRRFPGNFSMATGRGLATARSQTSTDQMRFLQPTPKTTTTACSGSRRARIPPTTICATNSANRTVVDTGVTPITTASTLFEILNPNGATTAFKFYINGTLVATISTNLPTAANQFGQFWCADNKNTATAVGAGFYWDQLFFTK
jgi:hypothetical protein